MIQDMSLSHNSLIVSNKKPLVDLRELKGFVYYSSKSPYTYLSVLRAIKNRVEKQFKGPLRLSSVLGFETEKNDAPLA